MTETGPPRLDQAMDERRLELALKWRQVAERADLTAFHLQRIRSGKVKLSKDAAAAIDRSMEWERGSAWRVYYEDGEPALLRPTPGAPPIPEGIRVDPADWAAMTSDERATYVRIVTGVRRRRQQSSRGA